MDLVNLFYVFNIFVNSDGKPATVDIPKKIKLAELSLGQGLYSSIEIISTLCRFRKAIYIRGKELNINKTLGRGKV